MKKVAVFTGNRAEYGLQVSALRAIESHPDLEYRLIVSGSHLDENFGSSIEEIKNDGLRIDAKIKIEVDDDSLISNVKAIGSTILKIGDILKLIKPDFFLVYGDRSEAFAAVIASTQMNIPTGHIEGGDLTEGGALDDSMRHAMTKLSHIHFTTNIQSKNRVLAMGEEAWRVHNVGFLAIDMINEKKYASPKEVSTNLGIDLSKPIILFTQHSVVSDFYLSGAQINESLRALEVHAKSGAQVVITYPNNDAGGRVIIDNLKLLEKRSVKGIQIHKSLGRHLYHGMLGLAINKDIKIVCVGNSSSGIKETPAFGCPTVNIGSRQLGRLRGKNVTDVDYKEKDIIDSIQLCLTDKNFRKQCFETDNPYFKGNSGEKIAMVISKISINKDLLRKKMTLNGEINNDGWYK